MNMIEEWYTEKWSDRDFNREVLKYPRISITGHFPSKGEIRLCGPKEDIEELIKVLTGEIIVRWLPDDEFEDEDSFF